MNNEKLEEGTRLKKKLDKLREELYVTETTYGLLKKQDHLSINDILKVRIQWMNDSYLDTTFKKSDIMNGLTIRKSQLVQSIEETEKEFSSL